MNMLSIKDIADKFGMAKAAAYRIYVKDETFPAPIRLSTRTLRWLESDIDAWLMTKRGPETVPANEAN